MSDAAELEFLERPAAGEPRGLLVLHHGRGTDESDLLPLADALDRRRRLHVVAPRGPLQLPGTLGYHWYIVPRVGHPDRDTFDAAFAALAAFHDSLWARTGMTPAQTVLGGFSMGAVMSYSLGLSGERPAPAGVMALSGFMPTVESWRPDFASRPGLRVFVAHGAEDPVIGVDFAREARSRLEQAGVELDYHESSAGHFVDPVDMAAAASWLELTLPG